MNSRSFPKNSAKQRRRGFTLVEMLVAVALVSILMTMFAQIFGLASDILSQQRGLASNDQTERTLRTIFRDDLDHRTFREVRPYAAGPTVGDPTITKREGYFHISEGSISDDTDDILQLSIVKDTDEDPLYGHARELTGFPIATHPNQPEFDDQTSTSNNVGSSSYGEVAYFLRNGNLYRRQILLRQPIISNNVDPTQGSSGLGGSILSAPYTGDFWNDFDYSAFYHDPMSAASPKFVGANARVNDEPSTVTPTITIGAVNNIPPSLGIPRFRWGFDVVSGQPRYKVSDGTNQFFIGRFTQQETSDSNFVYPGSNPVLANWMDPTANIPAYDSTNGVVTALNGGPRVAEDILLRNVHSFDIKVWDPAVNSGPDEGPGVENFDDDGSNGPDDLAELGWPGSDDGAWRDLGHTDPTGFYTSAVNGTFGNHNIDFGAFPIGTPNGNCYDTWHPTQTASFMPGGVAPYRPVLTHALNGDLPQPLTLIRIHIRYVDQKSDQMRDAIIIHSLKTE